MKTLFLSVDPYMRCRFNEETGVDYVAPFQIGSPIEGGGVGEVIESNCDGFIVGDIVSSQMGWQWADVFWINPLHAQLQKHAVSAETHYSDFLGVYGIPGEWIVLIDATVCHSCFTGLTAYFCMLDQGNPQPGETVLLSGAAGACGTIAGQLAIARGSRVVGICGTDAKCRYLVEVLHFDAAINYKPPFNLFEKTSGDLSDAGTAVAVQWSPREDGMV